MIKIIFSDMDGTLLTSDNKLPPGFDEMMVELKKRGVIFTPASGRQYFSLTESFGKYIDEFMFLSDNGTLVTKNGKEIFSQPMNLDDALKMLEFGNNFDVLKVFCGKKSAYVLKEQDKPRYIAELKKYFDHNVAVEKWEDVDDTPIKVSFFSPDGDAKEVYEEFKKVTEHLNLALASAWWTDVTAPGACKGVAVENALKTLNIKRSEAAAFGDYMNDLEMLKAVDYSFAMSNAHPSVKEVAKFQTVSNDEFGVMVGIKKLMDEGLI